MSIRNLSLVLAAGLLSLSAHAASPSDASIDELLRVTRAQQAFDASNGVAEHTMREMMEQMMDDEKLSPAARRIYVEKVPARFAAVVREEMSWDKLQPETVAIYRDVYTQEEVDAQIAFYRTPVGQSVLDKMPQVMQRSIAISQRHALAMAPRLKAVLSEAMAEAKAAEPKSKPKSSK